MRTPMHKATIVATLSMMMASAIALADSLPPVQTSGHVEYLSGGVGEDEASAIEYASKQWPLMLEFAVKEGKRAAFAADVSVSVRGGKGMIVLQTNSGGPLLLVKLAPGRYVIEATLAGKTLHKKVLVKLGHPAKAVFIWPAGTGENSP